MMAAPVVTRRCQTRAASTWDQAVMLNGGGGTRFVARQKGSEEHTEAQLLKPAAKERSKHSTVHDTSESEQPSN
ncbi:unnamed protein product [Musa textilis]